MASINKKSQFTPDALASFNRSHCMDDLEKSDEEDSNNSASCSTLDQSSGFLSGNGSGGGGSGDDNTRLGSISQQDNLLSRKESRKVFRLRLIVILVLIATAFIISSVVFKITTDRETNELETQYEGAAGKVIDSFEAIMDRMGSVSGLGVS